MSGSTTDATPWRAFDTKDFSEDEYKRELMFHHIKIGPGDNAAATYQSNYDALFGKPRSGVFRDFKMYGVHPARVAVQHARITIPFLVSSLSATQLATEITNQKARKTPKKPADDPSVKWSEEDDAALSGRAILPSGYVLNPPLVDSALELIQLFQKADKPFIAYAPPMQRLMSALNLYYFVFGNFDLPRMYLVPTQQQVAMELMPLVSQSAVIEEIRARIIRDPGRWGDSTGKSASTADTLALLMELMTTEAETTQMRHIVNWYRLAHRRRQTYAVIERTLAHSDQMIETVQIRNVKRER